MSDLRCCDPCAQCQHERERAAAWRAALEKIQGSPCPLSGQDCSCCGFAINVAEMALDDSCAPDRLVDETAYDDEEADIMELRTELAEMRRRLSAMERPGALRALEDPEAFRRGQEAARRSIVRWLDDRYAFLCRTKMEGAETAFISRAITAREDERVSPHDRENR